MEINAITIEQLEKLATELEADQQAQHQRLIRLCRAYGRILAAREPATFVRHATHCGDVAGHWDSSFPPGQEYSDFTGPALITLAKYEIEDIATSGGFYYEWRRATSDGGLYIDLHGRWYRADETGTGRLGQFAAHPGDCDVDCTIEWSRVGDDDVTIAELQVAEGRLRTLAFPLIAAAGSASS